MVTLVRAAPDGALLSLELPTPAEPVKAISVNDAWNPADAWVAVAVALVLLAGSTDFQISEVPA
jgi:hypothetical protein